MTTPAPSLPGTSGGAAARGCKPARTVRSSGVTPAEVTPTSAWPAPGWGGMSTKRSAS
jgi:hypothetical protein